VSRSAALLTPEPEKQTEAIHVSRSAAPLTPEPKQQTEAIYVRRSAALLTPKPKQQSLYIVPFRQTLRCAACYYAILLLAVASAFWRRPRNKQIYCNWISPVIIYEHLRMYMDLLQIY
jgi:hypothetical protein